MAWLAGAVALLVAVSVGYHHLLRPRQALLPNPYSEVPDYDAIAKAITGAPLQEDLDRYLAFGSRFTGSEGFERLADSLIERFRALGYRVLLQEHEVLVPKTVFCRLLGEDGQPLPGFRLYPYYPNRFRTATTPPGGLSGRVVYKGDPSDQDKIAALDRCAGNIVLLRIRERFQDYANFGAKAVLYFDDKAHDTKAWHYRRKESHCSIDVPVFFVEREENADPKALVEFLNGRTVTLSARVDWVPTRVRNILAVLDPAAGAKADGETLVASAYYDTWSSIPDLAPGARQTLNLQTLMLAAQHLATSPNRAAFRRRVAFFLAAGHGQAEAGSRHLLSALGTEPQPDDVLERLTREQREYAEEAARLEEVAECAPRYFAEVTGKAGHTRFWRGRGEAYALFHQELSHVLAEPSATAQEQSLQARLEWIRAGSQPGPALDAYLVAGKRAQLFESIANAKPYSLVGDSGYRRTFGRAGRPGGTAAAPDAAAYDAFLAERVQALDARLAFRLQRTRFYQRQVEQDLAVFHDLRGDRGDRRLANLEVNITDKTNQLVLASGAWWWATRCVPADREFALQFRYAQEKLNPLVKDKLVSIVPDGDAWSLGGGYFSVYYFISSRFVFSGYTSFLLTTKGDDREFYATPMDTPEKIKWDNVVDQERIIVAGLEQIALGGATFIPISVPAWGKDFDGVVTSVRGNSLVPNHAEPDCVVQMEGTFWPPGNWMHYSDGGSYFTADQDPYPMAMSDELGRFRFRNSFAVRSWTVSFHAARCQPETGALTWIRDLGYQTKYPTDRLRVFEVPELVRIVLFRCAPIHLFKAENPQKMQLYDRVEARLRRGFAAPRRYYSEQFYGGEYVLYLEPDAQFYPTFLFGAPHNPNLLRIAGIGLNVDPAAFAAGESPGQEEVEGPGYLAADASFLYHPEDDLARSMATINGRRVQRYARYNLLDEATLEANAKARSLALEAAALRGAGRHYDAFSTMKESLAYSTTIHPTIRNAKSEAVYGIIFYLLLLIPFSFFAEKLLFGKADIRQQIAIVGAIFLTVFALLREIHPAFEIVRSSFMILLGFITLILSLLVTFFVGTKFRSAIQEYQKVMHGQQATAEVTRAGAAMTGFLLGINNMRKRKVRTALTAITLVLITFVMICFSAVENSYIEVEYPIGKASYTGIEIRKNNLAHLGNQTTVLVNFFENDFDVAVRRWDVAGLWGIMPVNKKIDAETFTSAEEVDNLPVTVSRDADGQPRRWVARGSMGIGPGPDFDVKAFLAAGDRWFKTESEKSCVLGLAAARELGITPEQVQGPDPKPTVSIQGRALEVINLFDDARLDAYRNRKGKPIVPVDQEAERRCTEQELREREAAAAAPATAPATATPGASPAAPTPAPVPSPAAAVAPETAPAATVPAPVAKPTREPVRLPAAGLVLFPKQRQPKPDTIVSRFKGKLRLNEKEPVNFDRMFVTRVPPAAADSGHRHYWFRNDDASTCFIPARMAAELRISPERVETSTVKIMVEGTELVVKGIYEGPVFDQIHDLDNECLAPYDVESIIGRPKEEMAEDEMPETLKRLSGDDIILCNDRSITAGWHCASVAIDLDKLGSHKRIRETLDRFLEKTGTKAFYGIGNTSYFGARFRRPRGGNYLELLIPLLIASLTVLNTMRGSVYERRDEIYVYNAVGLNPFHIFFLFMAEACVYAVIGALGGYLVANATGTVLQACGLQAGVTINYSSIYAVLYSLVIMLAVLASTWFPARAAARLAAPADEMKWSIPAPVDGVIAFALPFTFSERDRVAIVAYFMGWFDEFGEGSSGKFHASPPGCAVERFGGKPVAAVRLTTWLRPYDLGVSQEVCLRFSEDPETEQTVAHLTLHHLSGDIRSWQRTNYLFLTLLRKHFLDWRVVPEEEKRMYLERARRLLDGTAADAAAG